jgi:hypothetical protein
MRPLPIAAALALAALVTAGARVQLEPEAQRIGRLRDPSWLPSGKAVRAVSFGQRLALADLYWLRTVMYIGEGMLAPQRGWDGLYPLGDIVTDLDPRFGYAYQVVGSNLTGIANRVEESDRLLQKGMRNVPDRWMLPFLYAFNKFFYEDDYATAAQYARRAAEVGNRPHLALLAANLSLNANTEEEYRSAIAFLEISRQQASSPEELAQLDQRLVKVLTYRELSRCEQAIATYRARTGHLPLTLLELVLGGLLPALPSDPSGGEIAYNPATGEVRSTALGPRQPLRVAK